MYFFRWPLGARTDFFLATLQTIFVFRFAPPPQMINGRPHDGLAKFGVIFRGQDSLDLTH